MDHSVTKSNLQNEMSSIREPQKVVTHDKSVDQNITTIVDNDKDSVKDVPINSSSNKLLSESRGNLRVAMLKQVKILNLKISKAIPIQIPRTSNKMNVSTVIPRRAIPPIKQAQQYSLHSRDLKSSDLITRKPSIDIKKEDLEELKKQHNISLNIKNSKTINDTLRINNCTSSNSTKVQSPVKNQVLPRNTLIVRKPLNPTKIINGPFVIPKLKTSTEKDANRIKLNSLVKPKSYQERQADEVITKNVEHKFPKSITVNTIPINTADREIKEYKPFKANIGGRIVTLRRMKTDVSGSRDLPCSSKQQAPKLCVRKSSDGTYRVTNNSAINTNVLAVKKFKSNIPNAELKKVEPPSVDSSDEDNQPSTSDAAYKRKSATSTVTSNVPDIEISDDEQFTTVVPIKKSKLDPENTLQEDNQKRNGIIFRRNTCFVPRPKLLLKSKRQNEITRRRNSCFMSDDHTNYTMPQSLIKSRKEDVVRKVSTLNSQDVSIKSDITITSPSNGDDLFMIQEDSNPNQRNFPMNNPGSSRRKSLLEPMDTLDEDTQFEKVKEPLDLPPRPRQNIQLIESLARYRTIVRFMLNRLEIQQIDFNNDDYINLYKMYRG